jgi:hypothetical protein
MNHGTYRSDNQIKAEEGQDEGKQKSNALHHH